MWLTGPVAPWHVGSSQTRARTRVPCIGRQTLNHCTTREAPKMVSFLMVLLIKRRKTDPSISLPASLLWSLEFSGILPWQVSCCPRVPKAPCFLLADSVFTCLSHVLGCKFLEHLGRCWLRSRLWFWSSEFLFLYVEIWMPLGSPEAGNQEIAVAKTPFSLSRLPGMTKGSELLTLISTVMNILVFAPSGSHVSSRMSCSL